MSTLTVPHNWPGRSWEPPTSVGAPPLTRPYRPSIAASITKAASRQTYTTVHFLVDPDRVDDAYRAYAYFRWLDDWLDQPSLAKPEQMAFVKRQDVLVERCYRGEHPPDVSAEEQLLVELISRDHEAHSGLRSYIQNMMAVMAFDAQRRGSVVSSAALDRYSLNLATAVTEALHYFIGHDSPAPYTPGRYLAATGAHVVHMLRDAAEDSALGYFNVPGEYLKAHRLSPGNVESDQYRQWVRQRVNLAKAHFRAGKDYLKQVPSARCRLAAFAYMARFTAVLRVIEREDYHLRRGYPDDKGWAAMLGLGLSTLALMLPGLSLTRNL
jgi:phytoene/squalene synthetase